jgi:hypothetical protein
MLIHNQVSVSVGGSEIACEDDIALTLRDAPKTFPAVSPVFWLSSDSIERSHGICDTLRERCQLDGSHEHLFLLLYFNRVIEKLKSKAFLKDVLLPLPKAQFSLADEHTSVTVDFAFWTGDRFVAVFIHESAFDLHGRSSESLLKIWGFDVFCLVADEFETRGLMGDTGRQILEAVNLSITR